MVMNWWNDGEGGNMEVERECLRGESDPAGEGEPSGDDSSVGECVPLMGLLRFLTLALLFWNHICTWRLVRPRCWLRYSRTSLLGMGLLSNSFSSMANCSGVFLFLLERASLQAEVAATEEVALQGDPEAGERGVLFASSVGNLVIGWAGAGEIFGVEWCWGSGALGTKVGTAFGPRARVGMEADVVVEAAKEEAADEVEVAPKGLVWGFGRGAMEGSGKDTYPGEGRIGVGLVAAASAFIFMFLKLLGMAVVIVVVVAAADSPLLFCFRAVWAADSAFFVWGAACSSAVGSWAPS